MKIIFKGSTTAFAHLIQRLVATGLTFETKWVTGDKGLEGQAEIILTGGF